MVEEVSGAQPVADIVVLGKVVDAYGMRGAVKVHPFADDPGSWGAMPNWWLGREEDAPELWQKLQLVRCREHSGLLIATLGGIADRNASEALRGLLVGAPRAELPVTPDGEYYWGDLVGLDVVNAQGKSLGRVLGLIATAANDVLRVGDDEGAERLLPFVAAVVLDVDVSARLIRVEWGADW